MSGWLIRWNALLLVFAVVLACGGFWLSSNLSFDWQITAMFAKGDPQVEAYHQLQKRFGGNEIVLAVYRDPQLWEEDGSGLERLASVSERLASVKGVSAVLSLAELHQILEQMRASKSVAEKILSSRLQLFGIKKQQEEPPPPLLDPDNELAQAFAEVFEGYTHRRESEFVAIACLLDQENQPTASQAKQPRHSATVARLRQELQQLPAPASNGLIAGEPVLVVDGFALVEQDGLRLGITSTVLVALTLLVSFRSIRWTLIPLLVVQWSLVATQALLVALGLQLTMVSSTLTAIVTVIGVATTTHLILRFQEFRRQGKGRAESLEMTYQILLRPIAWACCTDALGFVALLSADVGPVRDFGLMMAIGSGMVFLAVCFVVPGLALIGRWDADPSTPRIDMFLRWSLRQVMEWCLSRRIICLTLLGLLFVAAIIGCLMVQVETDFTRNFASDSPLVTGYRIIEGELGGAGVWDVMVPTPKVITKEYLAEVLKLQSQLAAIEIPGEPPLKLQKVLSLASAIEATNTDGFLSALPLRARISGMSATMPEFTRALISDDDREDGRWLRIMLRSPEQAPAQSKSLLIAEVQQVVSAFTKTESWQSAFPDSQPQEATVTGYHVMLAQLVGSVIRDQWKCFLVALILIGIAMTIAFQSWKLALAALLPNVLPILAVLGVMGWLSIRVNMGAAMMAAVSMGLSIDSSIHYLMHFRRRTKDGSRPIKALRSAQETVGLAALLATVSLIAGFLTMAVSEFMPTVVFGILAALSMLGGLLGNLVILPLLIAKAN